LDPRFHLSPVDEKLRYDQHQNTSDNIEYIETFKRFIETAITPYPATQVLDYGCGPNPVLAELLKSHNLQTDIYDPFYFPTEPQVESYDLITSTEVFEHLREPLVTLEHINKLLKPGGYLAIMTKFLPPNDQFVSWRYKDDTTHISFYSPKTFIQISQELELIQHNNQDIIVLRKKPSKLS
jgi:2-polyprenyl-3-methyl-5-hydroxy-6-metoxy-1,4-benzoquinol methylase